MPNETHLDTIEATPLEALEAELKRRREAPEDLIDLPKEGLQAVPDSELWEAVIGRQRVIYGTDSREDFWQISDARVKRNAEAVVAIMDEDAIEDMGNQTSRLKSRTFRAANRLCASEPFGQQPVVAWCSGFLVGEDLIATAGHCVEKAEPSKVKAMRFVFGFRMSGVETAVTVVPNSDIYRAKKVVGHELTDDGTDWSLIRLDRKVVGRTPVHLRSAGKVTQGTRLYVLGHPCGLPLKHAGQAAVRDNHAASFFTANLDTYGGNSGSPVFNEETHQVEGILVRGDTDFVKVGNCYRSLVVPKTGGRGEDVTRISEVLPLPTAGD